MLDGTDQDTRYRAPGLGIPPVGSEHVIPRDPDTVDQVPFIPATSRAGYVEKRSWSPEPRLLRGIVIALAVLFVIGLMIAFALRSGSDDRADSDADGETGEGGFLSNLFDDSDDVVDQDEAPLQIGEDEGPASPTSIPVLSSSTVSTTGSSSTSTSSTTSTTAATTSSATTASTVATTASSAATTASTATTIVSSTTTTTEATTTTTEATTTTDEETTTTTSIDVVELLDNGDFDRPRVRFGLVWLRNGQAGDWLSTNGVIQLGRSGFDGFESVDGGQFAELNSTSQGGLYQDLEIEPGSVLEWSFWHRGRDDFEKMALRIGDPDDPEVVETMQTSTTWTRYSGTWDVPDDLGTVRFLLESLESGSVGNLVDNVTLSGVPS